MPGAAKEPQQEFPTTWWTLIGDALADGTTVRTAALEELVRRYRPPLRAHLLLRRRLDEELADELLQGFITEKILEQYLLRHADRSKGKFRSLLVRSLENYYADWGRARAFRPVTGIAAAGEEGPADPGAGADVFDVAWARQLLVEALEMMKADCDAGGQTDIWGVFELRLLVPMREQSEPLPYDEICARFGFASPEQASNALITAKRKFHRAFERVALRYRHDGEQAEDILHELIDILSRAGTLAWRDVAIGVDPADSEASSSRRLADSKPALVARFLEVQPDADALWLSEDLVGLMRHQLAQRLVDLDLKVGDSPGPSSGSSGAAAPPETLADLYQNSMPSIELLEAVKRYGRKRTRQPDGALPGEIASALYFASIAAALVRHGQRITTSDDDLLRWGFESLLSRPWIEAPLRKLFEEALAGLGPCANAATER